MDIHGKFLKILRSMYSQLFACVSTYEGLTNFFKCLTGTRQGCMLSPLLFVLYLNSYIELNYNDGSKGIFLDEMFSNLFLLLYADDIAQFSDRIWYLQDQINTLQTFCTKSGMQVNVSKT